MIALLKEKAAYVTEKLQEIFEMLHIKGTDILAVIKDKVAALVTSPYFEFAIAMLPESMREPVHKVVNQLKEWLGIKFDISEQ